MAKVKMRNGEKEPFIWGVWVSLSEDNFKKYLKYSDQEKRSCIEPFGAWLDAWLKPYPDTRNLKATIHLRDHSIRPFIELESTDHPLAIEQREGISLKRAAELYSIMMHE